MKYAWGIDIGTTSISMIIMDCESGELIKSRTINHNAFLQGHIPVSRIQDPEKLTGLVLEAVKELAEAYGKPECIGLTGQMHGMLYVDEDGNAVSPLYIWQDGCGNEPMEDGRTYAEVLKQTGGAAATGFGLITHYYLQKNGMIPEDAVSMVTISDYLGMKLCGSRHAVIARDMAASWGCFDLEKGIFGTEKLQELGVDISYLPELMTEHTMMGYAAAEGMEGVPVMVSLGDNQASVIGSVQNMCDTLLINVGTGSQVSVGTSEYQECTGSVELRPCTGEVSMLVGSSLCGGRAYAMLEQFYRAAGGAETELYESMEQQAREFLKEKGRDSVWKVKTSFAGTRSNPQETGGIQGITVENFHPGAMTLGIIQGILEELHEMYAQMSEKTGRKAGFLVGSGNGIRRNKLMQELAEEMFGMKLKIPVCREEAAYGAALHAMAATGIVGSLEEAQKKIRYCE